jgi:hypothetical protein
MLHFTSIHSTLFFADTLLRTLCSHKKDILCFLSLDAFFFQFKKSLARLETSFSSCALTSIQSMAKESEVKKKKTISLLFPITSNRRLNFNSSFSIYSLAILFSSYVSTLRQQQRRRRQLAYFMSIIIGLFNEFILPSLFVSISILAQ